jgi:hypothetical protein
MNIFMTIYAALLFMLLTPGILMRIPKNKSFKTAAFVHGLIFAVLYHFTHRAVWRFSNELNL